MSSTIEFLSQARSGLEYGETLAAPTAAVERAVLALYPRMTYTGLLEALLAANGYVEENEIRALCDGIGVAHETLTRNPDALAPWPPRRFYPPDPARGSTLDDILDEFQTTEWGRAHLAHGTYAREADHCFRECPETASEAHGTHTREADRS